MALNFAHVAIAQRAGETALIAGVLCGRLVFVFRRSRRLNTSLSQKSQGERGDLVDVPDLRSGGNKTIQSVGVLNTSAVCWNDTNLSVLRSCSFVYQCKNYCVRA